MYQMKFQQFAFHIDQLTNISSRLQITAHLATLWQQLDTTEIAPVSYMLLGRLAPTYINLEFGLSTKMVLRSLARLQSNDTDLFGQVSNESQLDLLTNKYKQLGDIGLLAAEVIATKSSELSINDVFSRLKIIAETSGEGSQEKKLALLANLWNLLDGISAKLVARIIVGSLRLGFSEATMLDSLSWSIYGSKQDSKNLELAFNKKADIGLLAASYLTPNSNRERDSVLQKYGLSLGIPMQSALCQRLNSAEEMIAKMGEVFAEPKYDGLRVQIHIDKSTPNPTIWAFTRNLENVTHMYPELQQVAAQLQVQNCILDAEAIGYRPETGELVPFQETMTRKRKHNISATAADLPLKFFIFDILYLNGQQTVDAPLTERKKLLAEIVVPNKTVLVTDYILTSDPATLTKFHAEQLRQNLEGMVVKQANGVYQSGRKGWLWAKIKEVAGTKGKLSDTIDVIVMGGYFGRGKRNQFGLGALLVGVPEKEEVLTVSKIGTGMTEAQLMELKKLLDHIQVAEKPTEYKVVADLKPDIWVRPDLVIEVAADELTKSSKHTAGLALRFPRLLKIRTDKNWTQATSLSELKEITIA